MEFTFMSIDRRIIKTRTSITKAFMELVETNEISSISVSELAAKALVNRSTFYLHYTDVQSVATDIENGLAERISAAIDDFSFDDTYGSIYILFAKLTNRLEENRTMKRYIVFSTNSDYIISKLKEIFVEKAKKALVTIFNCNEKDIEYSLTFAVSGLIDCYVKWARSDSSTPLDDVMRKIGKFTEYILSTINIR